MKNKKLIFYHIIITLDTILIITMFVFIFVSMMLFLLCASYMRIDKNHNPHTNNPHTNNPHTHTPHTHTPHTSKIDEVRSELTCKLCNKLVQIPVIMGFRCSHQTRCSEPGCNYFVCLRCARDYLELNKRDSDRSDSKKCLCCDTQLELYGLRARDAYRVVVHIMNIMNKVLPIDQHWTCTNCDDTDQSKVCGARFKKQQELWTHLCERCDYGYTNANGQLVQRIREIECEPDYEPDYESDYD